jgi:hypothetical protein
MAGFDPTLRIWIQRRGTRASGGRRSASAGSSDRRWRDSPARPQTRAPGHGSTRGRHLRDVRRTADRSRAAALAEMRRHGWSTRRRGTRTPARFLGRQGAWGRRRATPTCCSPPGATLERLLGGGKTTTAEIDGGGAELELEFVAARG